MENDLAVEIQSLEQQLAVLAGKLAEARSVVQSWVESNAALSRSAAEARAANQAPGRGLLGGLLGSKYRSAIRQVAAASNAAIAREVAAKRASIAEGKRLAQEVVREIQSEIASTKRRLKELKSKSRLSAQKKKADTSVAAKSLDLLLKLKEARDAGLLSESEFEEKRKKLVSSL